MFDYVNPAIKEMEDRISQAREDQDILDRINANYTTHELIEMGFIDVDQEYEAFVAGSYPAAYPDSSKIFRKMIEAITVSEACDMLFVSEADMILKAQMGELEI